MLNLPVIDYRPNLSFSVPDEDPYFNGIIAHRVIYKPVPKGKLIECRYAGTTLQSVLFTDSEITLDVASLPKQVRLALSLFGNANTRSLYIVKGIANFDENLQLLNKGANPEFTLLYAQPVSPIVDNYPHIITIRLHGMSYNAYFVKTRYGIVQKRLHRSTVRQAYTGSGALKQRALEEIREAKGFFDDAFSVLNDGYQGILVMASVNHVLKKAEYNKDIKTSPALFVRYNNG